MSDLFTFRFPSGDSEYRTSEKAPELGDIIRRNGDTWIVQDITEGEDGSLVVTLRPLLSTGRPA